MEDVILQYRVLIGAALLAVYGVYRFWPSISWALGGIKLPGFTKAAPSRSEAFAALEVLRVHFKDNKDGRLAVEAAGSAFWKEPASA